MARSKWEQVLADQLLEAGLPAPVEEYQFHIPAPGEKRRQWRFDFCWPDVMFAVEVEGGGWTGGRHTRGLGFTRDLEKYHTAMDQGWTLYRCDGALIKTGLSVSFIKKVLSERLDL